MEPAFQLSQERLSLDDQLSHLVALARDAVKVDRLHLWGLAPEGGRLLYVVGSGLSREDSQSLVERPELPLADAGSVARAVTANAELLAGGFLSSPRTLSRDARLVTDDRVYAVPIVARGVPLGLLTADNKYSAAPLVPRALQALQTFAQHAAAAIDNIRLTSELHTRSRELTQAQEQQMATSEILKVISQSRHDVQPVFEAIASSARKLCDGDLGGVYTFDGERIHHAFIETRDPSALEAIGRDFPMVPTHSSATGRAVLTRRVIHVPDVLAEEGYALQAQAQAVGFRSVLSVPMLRNGVPIGTINVSSARPNMFSARHLALIATFAD
jgi:GAF domain-containing protein